MVCGKCNSRILKLRQIDCEMYVCPCCGEVEKDVLAKAAALQAEYDRRDKPVAGN